MQNYEHHVIALRKLAAAIRRDPERAQDAKDKIALIDQLSLWLLLDPRTTREMREIGLVLPVRRRASPARARSSRSPRTEPRRAG